MIESNEAPIYKHVIQWVQEYGQSGEPDQRAVQTFMDCETREAVNGLRAELIAISAGKFNDQTFDVVVGIKRRVLHSSYAAWAQLMLQWIAAYKV